VQVESIRGRPIFYRTSKVSMSNLDHALGCASTRVTSVDTLEVSVSMCETGNKRRAPEHGISKTYFS